MQYFAILNSLNAIKPEFLRQNTIFHYTTREEQLREMAPVVVLHFFFYHHLSGERDHYTNADAHE
jgi:hypothetical protein